MVSEHFVPNKIQEKVISLGHVKIGDQLGDIFTKALNRARVDYIYNKLGMINKLTISISIIYSK